MNLRELHLDAVAVIPGAVDIAGGTAQKREQSFHVDEGWDLREVLPGVFSISRADMPHAVTVGGCGYSYVALPFEMSAGAKAREAALLAEEKAEADAEREAQSALEQLVPVAQHQRKGKR